MPACRDHLGNEYPSVKAMCCHWGVPQACFVSRIDRGWDLERALAEPTHGRGRACVDHLGNEFPSKAAMCEHWGIPYHVYMQRVRAGWDLERALTEPVGPKEQPCKDHEGNEFPSQAAMCEYWGVDWNVYYRRVRAGWTLEQALTDRPELRSSHNAVPCTDHLGNDFPSESAMCRAWGVSTTTYRVRMRKGWTVVQALTGDGPRGRRGRPGQSCVDHLGNEYPSKSAMCRAWGVSFSVYDYRLKSGWTLEQALTGTR